MDSMQSLSKMMSIPTTPKPGLGCCVTLAHAQPIKLLVCGFYITDPLDKLSKLS